MNAEKFNELLVRLNACDSAVEWAKGKTLADHAAEQKAMADIVRGMLTIEEAEQ